MPRAMQVGVVLPQLEDPPTGQAPSWETIRHMARRAEALGFDAVWVADELVWGIEPFGPRGWWEGVALAGAVAASTSTIGVGTWVLWRSIGTRL